VAGLRFDDDDDDDAVATKTDGRINSSGNQDQSRSKKGLVITDIIC